MKQIQHPEGPAVLVSWVSVRHGPGGLVEALGEPASPLARGRVSRLYLCWRDVAGKEGDDERRALSETARTLERELHTICPEIIKLSWKTDRPPTDHAALRPFGEEVLRSVRADNPEAHVFIHVSAGTPAMHAVWLVLGTTGFIDGPVTLIHGIEAKHRRPGASPVALVNFELDTWLRRYRQARPQAPRDDDDGRIWDPSRVRSEALRAAFAAATRCAPLRAPVLLLGERGIGKTTLANLIRSRSPHQRLGERPWPVVVCGQFRANPQLARSELFGHKRGAFTGATASRPGLIEQADGDTLFLDEVADLDHDTQRLLMAAIEGRGFHRLGDPEVRHSRFRLISATNRTLAELRGGLLDRDFLDRLAVFVVEVPPLRDAPTTSRSSGRASCGGPPSRSRSTSPAGAPSPPTHRSSPLCANTPYRATSAICNAWPITSSPRSPATSRRIAAPRKRSLPSPTPPRTLHTTRTTSGSRSPISGATLTSTASDGSTRPCTHPAAIRARPHASSASREPPCATGCP